MTRSEANTKLVEINEQLSELESQLANYDFDFNLLGKTGADEKPITLEVTRAKDKLERMIEFQGKIETYQEERRAILESLLPSKKKSFKKK